MAGYRSFITRQHITQHLAVADEWGAVNRYLVAVSLK
jgi:hypothetical protein